MSLGAAATSVAPCLLEISMQSPVNFLLRELCTLGHRAVSLLPQSWESAAGPDTVTHTEKGNSEVCLTNCAPPRPQLEKGSHVVQADLESVYFVLLVIKPRNLTCSASILPTELHPSPCCVVKGELEFCHRLPPMSETAPHSRPPAIELLSQVLTSEHTDVFNPQSEAQQFP